MTVDPRPSAGTSHPSRSVAGGGPWPTIDDVRLELRLEADPVEDPVIQNALDAAVNYIDRRTGYRYTVDAAGDPLEPPQVSPKGFEATVLFASRLYRRRDSLDGTIGWGDLGVIRVGRSDADVEALLADELYTPL